MNISKRLNLMLGLLFVAVGAVAGLMDLLAEKAHRTINTIHNDRVIPLKQLRAIEDMLGSNVIQTAHKVHLGLISPTEGLPKLEEAEKHIDQEWKAYLDTYLVEDEKRIAENLKPLMTTANEFIGQLKLAMKRGDQETLSLLISQEMYPRIDPAYSELIKLIELQVRVSEEEFTRYRESRQRLYLIVGGCILALLVISTLVHRSIRRKIVSSIESLGQAIREIEHKRDMTVRLPVSRNDEMGQIAHSFNTLLDYFSEQVMRVARQSRASSTVP